MEILPQISSPKLVIYKSNRPELKFPFYILNDNDYYLTK